MTNIIVDYLKCTKDLKMNKEMIEWKDFQDQKHNFIMPLLDYQFCKEESSKKRLEIAVDKLNKQFIEEMNASRILEKILNAVKKEQFFKFESFIKTFKKQTTLDYNRYPLSVGDRVFVRRSCSGYFKKNMKVEIIEATKNEKGIWQYRGQVLEEDEKTLSNFIMTISHTRDFYLEDIIF